MWSYRGPDGTKLPEEMCSGKMSGVSAFLGQCVEFCPRDRRFIFYFSVQSCGISPVWKFARVAESFHFYVSMKSRVEFRIACLLAHASGTKFRVFQLYMITVM
jgi:hypothetical protein